MGESNINKMATRFMGNQKVMGDCLIVVKSTETEFIDLNLKEFQDIMKLCWGPLSNRKVLENDRPTKVNNLPIVRNRYHVLNEKIYQNSYEKKSDVQPGQDHVSYDNSIDDTDIMQKKQER